MARCYNNCNYTENAYERQNNVMYADTNADAWIHRRRNLQENRGTYSPNNLFDGVHDR